MSKWTALVALGISTARVYQNRIQVSDNFRHCHARDNPYVYILYQSFEVQWLQFVPASLTLQQLCATAT